VSVRDAIAEFEEVQGKTGIQTGLKILDNAIAPGLLPAQLMVVLAKSGVGKTLFLLNLMHRMSMVPGQEHLRFLFLSLEQTRGEWWDRARRIHRFYNIESTEQEAEAFWQDRLMIVDKNRLSEAEIVSALDDFDYQLGGQPDVIMLDYLGYWAQGFKGERYERVSDAVMNLKAMAKDRRIPIITPHQVSRGTKYGEEPDTDAARDAGVIEETADFVLLLWSPDTAVGRQEEEKSGVVQMKIGKSRHGGRGKRITLQFAPISLALVPQESTAYAQMAVSELQFDREYGDSWERAVYRHRTGFRGTIKGDTAVQEGYDL
jgi:replicative DNA helicase